MNRRGTSSFCMIVLISLGPVLLSSSLGGESSPVDHWDTIRITDYQEGENRVMGCGFRGNKLFWQVEYWGDPETYESGYESLMVTDITTLSTRELYRIDDMNGSIGGLYLDGDMFVFEAHRDNQDGYDWVTEWSIFLGDVERLDYSRIYGRKGLSWGLEAFRYPWLVLSHSVGVEEGNGTMGSMYWEEDLLLYNIQTEALTNLTTDEGNEYCSGIRDDMRALIVRYPRDEHDETSEYCLVSVPDGEVEVIYSHSGEFGASILEDGRVVTGIYEEDGGICIHYDHFGLFLFDPETQVSRELTVNSYLVWEYGHCWEVNGTIFWTGFYEKEYLGRNDTSFRLFMKRIDSHGAETEILSSTQGPIYPGACTVDPEGKFIIAYSDTILHGDSYIETWNINLLVEGSLDPGGRPVHDPGENNDPTNIVVASVAIGTMALIAGVWRLIASG